ncbi:MAG: MoxR family ATPase [Candidatus Marinimicrobia bacterium]|nr:MoxR family ATPase [Candidatus Neomarinimicrobiota bacterium]MBT3945976.1 MoxR family ATPase [Candidatus Neomarinimicrobiota bacterium]MBT4154878.1 MoxR family ATPase [Candidatus Neomarinimicrobiota bacterium]MBT4554602.1 MoxR family ATPase [Candidatus Neomarinimicrobiota bacterium]MBT4753560.1 MoxR family ATPase [Candidatus Neomarinimicrobiota bacterium]
MSDFSLKEINERISKTSEFVDELKKGMGRVIIGQDELVNKIIVSMLANGHILLEGVPGLAKTLMVNTLSKLINTNFQRIQFTPDMLPADLLGTLIYNQKTGEFDTRKGPIFSNIILADEINRSPAKVQSALLEAMQERQVTIGENTFLLDAPFLVMATQNPIEQEGTYPLPEAQVDRFMFKLIVDYPDRDSERLVLRQNTKPINVDSLKPIVESDAILEAQAVIHDIYVDEKVEDYVLNLIFATRNPEKYGLKDLEGIIDYGASPRATINLIRAAKARAFTEHRGYITPEDIRYIGADVLRHRIILTYEAEAEELTPEDVIQRLFEVVEVP